jgi:hypothetical protein
VILGHGQDSYGVHRRHSFYSLIHLAYKKIICILATCMLSFIKQKSVLLFCTSPAFCLGNHCVPLHKLHPVCVNMTQFQGVFPSQNSIVGLLISERAYLKSSEVILLAPETILKYIVLSRELLLVLGSCWISCVSWF